MSSEADQPLRGRIIKALGTAKSVRAAAKEAGCHASNIYQSARSDERVRTALEAHQARGGQGRKRTAQPLEPEVLALRDLAVQRVRDVLQDEHASARDRLAAAKLALEVTRPSATQAGHTAAEDKETAEREAQLQAEVALANAGRLLEIHRGGKAKA